MKKMLLLLSFIITHNCWAQNIGINTTGNQANASAILDVSSTSEGVLIPRMTTAQRLAIVSAADGLVVYDTDLRTFMHRDNTNASWRSTSTLFISCGNNGTQAHNTTTYMQIGIGAGTTQTNSYFVVPRDGVLANLYVVSNTNTLTTATTKIDIQTASAGDVAGLANSTLTVTLAAGVSIGNDLIHTVSVKAGDVICVVSTTANSGSGNINDMRVSFEIY